MHDSTKNTHHPKRIEVVTGVWLEKGSLDAGACFRVVEELRRGHVLAWMAESTVEIREPIAQGGSGEVFELFDQRYVVTGKDGCRVFQIQQGGMHFNLAGELAAELQSDCIGDDLQQVLETLALTDVPTPKVTAVEVTIVQTGGLIAPDLRNQLQHDDWGFAAGLMFHQTKLSSKLSHNRGTFHIHFTQGGADKAGNLVPPTTHAVLRLDQAQGTSRWSATAALVSDLKSTFTTCCEVLDGVLAVQR